MTYACKDCGKPVSEQYSRCTSCQIVWDAKCDKYRSYREQMRSAKTYKERFNAQARYFGASEMKDQTIMEATPTYYEHKCWKCDAIITFQKHETHTEQIHINEYGNYIFCPNCGSEEKVSFINKSNVKTESDGRI